jgi:hypothetical protein
MASPPPLHTHLGDLLGWTLDRTAALPKSQRHTFGQRIDNLTLDAVERCVEATYGAKPEKQRALAELNLTLEKLRVLWRLIHERGWISLQQLVYVIGQIDEAGRMVGGWSRSIAR